MNQEELAKINKHWMPTVIQDILLGCVGDHIQRSIIYVLWLHGVYSPGKVYYVYCLHKEKTHNTGNVWEQC